MNSREFIRIHVNLGGFTWFHVNLREFTWKNCSVPALYIYVINSAKKSIGFFFTHLFYHGRKKLFTQKKCIWVYKKLFCLIKDSCFFLNHIIVEYWLKKISDSSFYIKQIFFKLDFHIHLYTNLCRIKFWTKYILGYDYLYQCACISFSSNRLAGHA